MSIVAEPYKEIKGLFPQGKIILHDGRMLDCYPLAAQVPDKIDEDHLELDTTGQYLSVGAKKPQPVPPKSKDTEEQKELYKRCKEEISCPVWCEETQTRYPSLREAARQLGIPKTTLTRRLHAEKKECRGYHFRLQRDEEKENSDDNQHI